MKLTAILLLAAALQVSAKGFGQAISLNLKNASLEKAITEIEKQSGFSFVYGKEQLAQAKAIDLTVNNEKLEKVLELIFKDQPLSFTISGKYIALKQKATPVIVPVPPVAGSDGEGPPPIDVHGRVMNDNGQPVEGATVTVKGTNKRVATNANGEFTLVGIDANATLIFTGTNVETFEIKVNGKNDLAINLKTKVSKLDEVQIIAYGQTTQRLNTGNVSTVKAEDIERQPVNNPLLALEGRVPGLFITQNTGVSGGGITVRLQGQNSLSRGSDPLYVIDGVPYISQLLPNISSVTLGVLGTNGNTNPTYAPSGGGNPLAFINPADIETISVLKDADATSIYGSRAANGAILITTKKGRAGKTKVNINVQNGWGKVARKLDLLNTDQYLTMRRQAYYNDSVANPAGYVPPTITTAPDLLLWDNKSNTDWQKVLIGGTAHYTDAQFSVSGGNATTQFLIGSAYHRETTVFPGDLSDQKGSFHLNLNHISLNQRFKLQVDAKYLTDNNMLISQDLTNFALRLPPNAPALYNPDGSVNWAPQPNGNSTWINPMSFLQKTYSDKTNNLIGNSTLGYQIIPNLELRTNLGYTNLQNNEINIIPLTSYAPETRPNNVRVGYYNNSNIHSWNIEPQMEYKRHLGKGTFNGLFGGQIFHSYSNGQVLVGTGYNSDLVIKDIRSASTLGVASSVSSQYKYAAMYARLNYNYNNRYVLNLTARRDGSSRFGIANQYHNFGSVAGAWLFSNEKFLNGKTNFLSFGKFRASYGTTGNDQIGDYQFLSLYSPYTVTTAYQGSPGIAPAGLPNPNLQWEETRKLQLGLDLGFFKDRILLDVNYYRNRSSNLLQSYALPIFTGNTSIQVNFPATVQNYGWEISLNTKNIDRKDFSWSSNINLTVPRNKLVAFKNLSTSTYANSYVTGQPVTLRKTFNLIGVDPATGLYQFLTSTGTITSGALNFATDQTGIINIDPKYYAGFQNNLRYKGFQIDLLFQYVNQVSNNYKLGSLPGRFSANFATGSINGNQPIYVLGGWGNAGETATIQRYSATYPSVVSTPNSFAALSNAAYSDASYIRLKNISLSWQIPDKWKRVLHLENARIYTQGQNLLTITNYKGLDPENPSVLNVPPLKVWTIGIQIGL